MASAGLQKINGKKNKKTTRPYIRGGNGTTTHPTKAVPGAKNGAPTKYKPEMCDHLIEYMGDGDSMAVAAIRLGITEGTLHAWAGSNKEFSEAKERGVMLALKFWEDIGKRIACGEGPSRLKSRKIVRKTIPVIGLDGVVRYEVEEVITETWGAATGNTAAWIFNMINRYPDIWKQRQEMSGPGGGPIPIAAMVATEEKWKELSDEKLRYARATAETLGLL